MNIQAHRMISLVREILKLTIIVICLIFAVIILVAHQNPLGFAALLPWALRSQS
jgi:hypothetical protein